MSERVEAKGDLKKSIVLTLCSVCKHIFEGGGGEMAGGIFTSIHFLSPHPHPGKIFLRPCISFFFGKFNHKQMIYAKTFTLRINNKKLLDLLIVELETVHRNDPCLR